MLKEGTTSIENFHQTLVQKLGTLSRPPVPSLSPNKKKGSKEIAKPLDVPIAADQELSTFKNSKMPRPSLNVNSLR